MQSRHLSRFSPYGLLGSILLALAGCSGGSGTSSDNAADACAGDADTCGQLLVGLTDAEGDFINYEIEVTGLRLQRANGSTVDVLPSATRIDFAQVTNLTEIVSAAFIPPGVYVGGSIDLDFTNADVHVEGPGGSVLGASVVDAEGNPLGAVSFDIQLDPQHPVLMTRRRATLLTFDFDLAASNTVDTGTDPAIVTAAPYIVATAAPLDQKDLRVRGVLASVDTSASTYAVTVRPWHLGHGAFGQLTVHTTAETSYEIGDDVLIGEAGLAALATSGSGTLTVAFGTYDLQSHEFTADVVHAGPNVSGVDIDSAYGYVVGRSGDTLLVKGAYLVRPGHDARFRSTLEVSVDAATRVTKIGDPDVLDAQAISIGQRVAAFGQLSTAASALADPASVPTLAASHVRLLVTELRGTVLGTQPGQLDIALRAIGPLSASQFDFTGTGNSSVFDAVADDYEISTGTLTLDTLANDENVKILGFVMPFGAAPPDFAGSTVIGQRDLPAALSLGWSNTGTAAPFLTFEPASLAVDVANPDFGVRHHLALRFDKIDVATLGSLSLVPTAADRGLYGLWEPGHVELFGDFSAFVAEVTARLGAGERARALYATGRYDEAMHELGARQITMQMIPVVP